MKTNIKKVVYRSLSTLVASVMFIAVFMPSTSQGHLVIADALDEGVQTQTFTISAYYSPLPCQYRYATGSYSSDIRLNGGGVHGADGTPVYPGMVAAPKTYAFGTKLYIPGVGIVGVHDRGGAIVTAGNRGQSYDRLDIWMGYGDKGLKRALSWGKRTVDVTIYGITDSVVEDIALDGYTEEEAIPNDCDQVEETLMAEGITDTATAASTQNVGLFASNMDRGASGENVTKLQNELKKLNYYKVEPSGVYDDLTVHAIYKFQQSQGIVADENTAGAGVFGPMTRGKINEIAEDREMTLAMIEGATSKVMNALVASE